MNAVTATETASMIRREIGDEGICVLNFDRPESGANIFDPSTLKDLSEHLDFIEKDSSLKGVIITSAKKSIFIAGADLKTLMRQAASGEMRGFIAEGQRIFNRLAALKIPTVAAIHGACAGGGYEITLACDYRIASDDPATRVGLPETTLGLIPAWGGATRLPRLISPEAAADVILKGKLYPAAEALRLGLVDEVVPRDQLFETARRKLKAGKRKSSQPSAGKNKPIAAPRDHNPALARAVDVINRGLTSSLEESLALELDGIVALGETESTRNLIRNFFLTERFRKNSSKTPPAKIVHAEVIGAGVMGSGIAQWLSSRGVSVILRDVDADQIDRGLANIDRIYAEAVKRGLMSEDKAKEGRARIVASTVPGGMRDVQIVIEAAPEKLEIKKQIFRDLASKTPKAILATNTSALSITDLAASTEATERVIGLHFFNPVSRMKLIEVVVSTETDFDVLQRSLAFARQIGRLPVVVRDSPGFLVNRVLFPYLLEAVSLYENDVDAKQIDDALVAWGMPMGPLRLIDEIGVDITVDIAETLANPLGRRAQMPVILRKMQEAKLLGRKTGSGFYQYEAGKQKGKNDALQTWRRNSGTTFSAEELAHRLIFLMVNEAARCLQEKVVNAPEDADFGMILGTGFAPFRGGPLRFAEFFGLKKLVAEMDSLADTGGEKFKPCNLLRKHAEAGTKFYEITA
ncbi:MAG TPA: 3-hydroxyacyl-CoA dehydrogenase NAD-binding domain-containing protein [Chthoniobacterales bacterium]